MSEAFSKDKLRGRAWQRFQRQVRKEVRRIPKRGAELQWFRDMLYIEKLSAVVDWCASKGMSVVLAKKANGTYEPDSKVVTLSGRAAPEKMLHYLLHECGHHLIGMEEHHERFGKGYPRGGFENSTNNFEHKLACLEEEMEAWHRGWKLAKRLGLEADREEFDRTRVECLRSYVNWAAERKKHP
jgi:hypothetical protein